ncbi:hypothetical protein DPMN_180713 [Dreissena polymorpha]|uniref:SH3 domain-containing protein n=1 Tax=Dreissena polymorpha TaxID=45954 RepID=A0A9D4I0W6_DREPO|nr:hypothetical protein DPMN_180713 [Dreissena polymorpha]
MIPILLIAPPAQAPSGHQKRVHALYDYNAWTEDELSFKEGDILILLHQHEDTRAMEGYVPRNYVALEDTQESRPGGLGLNGCAKSARIHPQYHHLLRNAPLSRQLHPYLDHNL